MQRLSLGLATLALICCLAMLAFVWQSSQAVIASQATQQELLNAAHRAIVESNETQAALIEQFAKVTDRAARSPLNGID